MTIPAYTGLQTALSGLEAAQAAITTTGENIANANTAGYTRQTVRTAATAPLTIPAQTLQGGGTQLGTGVSITDISRIRNQFLDVQYRAQNSATSNANSNATELGQVQTAMTDSSSSGLQDVMANFWTAWNALGNTQSPATLQGVVGAGQTLASTFNAVAQQIQTVQSQASQQYSTLTGANGQVAQDAQQIATLNAQISQAQQAGISPNTLMDQRDSALDDLSSLAQISVSTGSNGAVTVNFGDASSPLVSGTTVTWPQTLTYGRRWPARLPAQHLLQHRPGRPVPLLAGRRGQLRRQLGQRAAALQPVLQRNLGLDHRRLRHHGDGAGRELEHLGQ